MQVAKIISQHIATRPRAGAAYQHESLGAPQRSFAE